MGPSAERSPEWYLSKPTITSPHVGERMAQDSHGPYPSIRTRVPSLSVGDRQDIDSSAENAGTRHEIPTESTTQGHVNAQSKTETPTTSILSLHCRMCEAPPTATTQPTATTCGHLFCSEYVPRLPGGVIHRLTPRQVHNTTCGVHVQVPRVQQFHLVVLFV